MVTRPNFQLTGTTLEMQNQALEDSDIDAISTFLLKNPHITEVDLSNNQITDQAIKNLMQHPELKGIHFNFNNNNIGVEGITALKTNHFKSYTCQGNNGLIDDAYLDDNPDGLNLSKLGLTDANITYLCIFLKNHPQITTVDLSDNDIADAGVLELCDHLKNFHSIKTLNLRHNDIDFVGMSALADDETVCSLDVRDNKGFNPALEKGQKWFLSFSKLCGYGGGDDGQCNGVVDSMIPSLVQTSSQKEIIRFNVHFKQIFDIYKAIGEDIVKARKIAGEEVYGKDYIVPMYFDKKYRKEFLTRFKSELISWFEHLSPKNQKKVSEVLHPLLGNIFHRQVNGLHVDETKNLICLAQTIQNFEALKQELNSIRQQALSTNIFLAITLAASRHIVSVAYNPSLDTWVFIDANQLPIEYVSDTETVLKKVECGLFTLLDIKPCPISSLAYVHKDKNSEAKQVFSSNWKAHSKSPSVFQKHGNSLLVTIGVTALAILAIGLTLFFTGGLAAIPLVGALLVTVTASLSLTSVICMFTSAALLGGLMVGMLAAGILKIKDAIMGQSDNPKSSFFERHGVTLLVTGCLSALAIVACTAAIILTGGVAAIPIAGALLVAASPLIQASIGIAVVAVVGLLATALTAGILKITDKIMGKPASNVLANAPAASVSDNAIKSTTTMITHSGSGNACRKMHGQPVDTHTMSSQNSDEIKIKTHEDVSYSSYSKFFLFNSAAKILHKAQHIMEKHNFPFRK